MTWLRYWIFVELGFVLAVSIAALFLLRRRAVRANRASLRYWVRLLGAGLGTLAFITLVITLERTLILFHSETRPAPSRAVLPPGLGFEVEERTFESPDGLTLAGWFVPSRNGIYIILLHGYGGNRTAMIWHAEQLTRAGYGVLLYDERASGESEGGYRTYGWEDPRDLRAAVDTLLSEDAAGIGAAGCSMGANIALYGAAADPRLGAVWADGAASGRARDLPPARNPIMALIEGSNYLLDWLYIQRFDVDAPPPLMEELASLAPRPVMFIGGGTPRPFLGSEADLFTRRYAEKAGSNAGLWVIDEAAHCDGPQRRPQEYAARLVGFFDSAFGIVR